MVEINGGKKLEAALARIARGVERGKVLKVGFLARSRYPDGTPVAMVAAIQNFGAPSRGIPPRPFFSNMVRAKAKEWPAAIAGLLVKHGYDGDRALSDAGDAIIGQLKQSILDTNSPPLKPATVKRKGFDKPLIDTAHMINSVDKEVK